LLHSFLVGDDGRVYEGVGWNIQGLHTQGYNNISLGIAFFGSKEGNAADISPKSSLQLCFNTLLSSQTSPKIQFALGILFALDFKTWCCDGPSPNAQASFSVSIAAPLPPAISQTGMLMDFSANSLSCSLLGKICKSLSLLSHLPLQN
jgi:hypothetical protein